MVAKKPEIVIRLIHAQESVKEQICAGIEEEGLLYRCEEAFPSAENANAVKLAMDAAGESTLGVGIGIYGDRAVLTHESFTAEKLLCEARADVLEAPAELQEEGERPILPPKKLGQNAARFVKKQPFLL